MALTPEKRILLKVFISLLIDLLGFTIILPLNPRIISYYQQAEHNDPSSLFGRSLEYVKALNQMVGTGDNSTDFVLFGGLLGSLFYVLQFLFSPLMGAFSDAYGRKKALLLSAVGSIASYVVWFFSSSFSLFLLSRIVLGVLKGNVHLCTAIVADVTTTESRSMGMAIVGVAFSVGFIIGPFIGAMFSMFDLNSVEFIQKIGLVHPFSAPALLSLFFAVCHFLYVLVFMEETKKHGEKAHTTHSNNPLDLFKVRDNAPFFLASLTHFFFLLIFSGMEFTLTFLTFERFQYTNIQQGRLFVFIGLIMILVQGGYVRRRAKTVGERRMALQGMFALVPGLITIAFARSTSVLYLGLFFMSISSAMVVPCLTSLASIYAGAQSAQSGRLLGVFRSHGSLSRCFGPLTACLIYWRFGGFVCYVVGGVLMTIPLLLCLRLPHAAPKVREE